MTSRLFVFSFLFAIISSQAKGVPKIMEITSFEIKAIVSASNYAEMEKLNLENYHITLTEELDAYHVSFIAKNKPPGYRGSFQGIPEPTLILDKETGGIVKKYLSR